MSEAVDLSVLVPCFNEAENLPEFTDRTARTLRSLDISWEVVLVDDGSADSTWAVLEKLQSRVPGVRAERHSQNMGMVQAWKTAFEASRGDHICIIDADLQYQPEDIARLWRELRFRNVDIVQGCRNALARARDIRYKLSRGLNIALNTLFRMSAKDNKSGFMVMRRSVFREILSFRGKYHYFQTFVLVAAKSRGFSYSEVDVLFDERVLGDSFVPKLPTKIVLRSLVDLVRGFLEFRFPTDLDRDLQEFLETHPPTRDPEKRSLVRAAWLRLYFATMRIHHWMITGRTRHYLQTLERSQYLSLEDMRTYQELRLRRLLEHAYYNVSYYRETFRSAGLKPTDIRTLDDLSKLPLLTKAHCRERLYSGLIANRYDPARVLKITTSGSTGEPFVCYADKSQLEFRLASTMRSMEWANYRFGDRQMRLWHQTIGMSKLQAFKEWLDAKMVRRRFIPVFEMKEASLNRVIEEIRRFRPQLIDGYAEAFNLLARYTEEKGLEGLDAAGVMSSAQTLPEESRRIISEAFGCEVFDKYGSREFSGIAYECNAHWGHHVVSESYIVEIIKDGRPAKPGETGEVVITDLNNFTMPLIRYQIGDLAVARDNSTPCPCGRGQTLIGAIQGRVQSIIVGTERQFVPGTFFAHLLKDYDMAVRKYQIVQEKFGEIDFYVIKGTRFTKATFEEILGVLHRHLGADLQIHVHFVDEIELVRTGKHNAVLSRLKIDFQNGTFTEMGRDNAKDEDEPHASQSRAS